MTTPTKKTIVIRKGERFITKIESEALPAYLRDISHNLDKNLLTAEQEIELSKRIQLNHDKKALDELVTRNLRFCISVAKEYQGKGVPLDDLIQSGNIGLMKAAELFDWTRGVRFVSFAVYYIKQGILECLTNQSHMIHIPNNIYSIKNKVAKAIEELKQKKGEHYKEVSKDELAKLINVGLEQMEDALASESGFALSFDQKISEDDDKNTLIDVIPQKGMPAPDADLDKQSLLYEINKLLKDALTEKEAHVIKLLFGIEQDRPRSLQEVADIIAEEEGVNCCKESIRQIRSRAILRLRLKERFALKEFLK